MILQDGEEMVLEVYPERSILGVWFFTKCLWFVFFGAFMAFWCVGFFGSMFAAASEVENFEPFKHGWYIFPSLAIVILVLSLSYVSALQKTFKYVVTNRRCIFIGGIVKRTERSIPFHKITDVERSQNLFERVLGISKVRIFTPGTASMNLGAFGRQSSEITYEGIANSEELSESINNLVRKAGANA